MRKGFVGITQLVGLDAWSEATDIVAKFAQHPGVDIKGAYYASAFQAGIDEFLIPQGFELVPRSKFLTERTKPLSPNVYGVHWEAVMNAFSAYLPDDWHTRKEFNEVLLFSAFLVELLSAMSGRASLLALSGIPDPSKFQGQLPLELSVPITAFLRSITDLQTSSPIPQRVVSADDVQRLNEIMQSDLFAAYSGVQSDFDDAGKPLEEAMPAVAYAARRLWVRQPQLIKLRRTSFRLLELTPKLVDAAFGKLPGALAEMAAKLGISFLEERRRVVIYDSRKMIADNFGLAMKQMLEKPTEKPSD